MRCPYCRHPDSRVVDSREQDEGQVIRRRRACQDCGRRFTTVEEATLAVIKRSGVTEPFSRQKVVSGVVKIKLYKGNMIIAGRNSKHSLYHAKLATYTEEDQFDHRASEGFIRIYGLPLKTFHQVQSSVKNGTPKALTS